MGCFVLGGKNGMGCYVRGDKTAWDVLSGVANRCRKFCPGWQKMAWDVLSYIPLVHAVLFDCGSHLLGCN